MNNINSSSVNSIRIVTTVSPNKKVSIISAELRMGRKGMITDNLSQSGIIVDIDLETGITVGYGVDKFRNKYIKHPDSNVIISGIEIPYWTKVINDLNFIALKYEGLNCAGWDIAITETGYEIIEVNQNPAARTIQIANLNGVYNKIKEGLHQ